MSDGSQETSGPSDRMSERVAGGRFGMWFLMEADRRVVTALLMGAVFVVLLLSYMLRIVTIAKHTLAIGPFVLRETTAPRASVEVKGPELKGFPVVERLSTFTLQLETNCRRRACSLFPVTTFPEQLPQRLIARADKARVNEEIRAEEVRVVEPDGEHGVHTLDEAYDLAAEYDLDLVEIAPDADPPVCKILDYGKYRYKQQKKEKERRKKSQSMQLKEIRFRPRTDTHDFNFKTDHARGFLEDGNKVKAYVQFRGRDIMYKDQGMDLLRRFIEELQELAKIDQPPEMEGRRMTTILSPHKR